MRLQNHFARFRLGLCFIMLTGLFSRWHLGTVHAQNVITQTAVAQVVKLEDLSLTATAISGFVSNRSPDDLRDIQLLIRYTWLWQDETKPGNIDPSTSVLHVLDRQLKPGERANFRFSPTPPLSKIAGGRFIITVSVMAYTAVKAPD